MRHKVSGYKLGRNTAHRRSLLRNLVTSVIIEERVETTVPKAKAARPLVEKMITLGKRGDLSARRLAASYLMTDEALASATAMADTRASSARHGTRVTAPIRHFWNCSAARKFSTRRRKSAPKLAPRRLPKPRRRWRRLKRKRRLRVLRQSQLKAARRKNNGRGTTLVVPKAPHRPGALAPKVKFPGHGFGRAFFAFRSYMSLRDSRW